MSSSSSKPLLSIVVTACLLAAASCRGGGSPAADALSSGVSPPAPGAAEGGPADPGPADVAAAPSAPAAPAPGAPTSATAADASPAAPAPARSRVSVVRRHGAVDGPLDYTVVEPAEADDALPLVLALHGRGDNAGGFARLCEELGLRARFIVVDGPLGTGGGGHAWYDQGSPTLAADVHERVATLVALLDLIAARYPKAPRPAIFGFSQGAVLTLQALVDAPGRFAAAAALSGRLVAPPPADAEPLPDAQRQTAILVTGGAKDHVIPVTEAWAAADALERLGYAPRRLPFPGTHSMPPQVREALVTLLRDTYPGL